MYYYIYDQFLSQKKYDKILAQIESKITDLGIKDKIVKMSVLRSFTELVSEALKKGAETIIVVGNDQTVNQIANLIAGQNTVLGIIPIEGPNYQHLKKKLVPSGQNSIANFLGIHDPLQACEIISARKIENINLGEVNNNYFIHSVKVYNHQLKIECDNKFSVTPLSEDNLVGIYNFSPEVDFYFKSKKFFNPQDSFLEVVIEPRDKKKLNKLLKSLTKDSKPNQSQSIFRIKKVNIKNLTTNEGIGVVDNFKVLKTPLDIKISDKKLKLIVGKDRKF